MQVQELTPGWLSKMPLGTAGKDRQRQSQQRTHTQRSTSSATAAG